MGDKSFTLFEINLHEPSFSTSGSIPDSARQLAEDAVETDEDGIFQSINVMDGDAEDTDDAVDEDVDVDDDVETDEDAESSGRGMGSTVVGLLLLAALAVAKKVLSGDDIDELAELDDLTDISVSDAEEAVEEVKEAEDTEPEIEADDGNGDGSAESSGRSKSGILVALVLLGALIVAKKVMSGDGGLAELDDLSSEDDDEESHDAALDTDENDEAATSIVDQTDADDEDGDHDAALDDDDEDDEE